MITTIYCGRQITLCKKRFLIVFNKLYKLLLAIWIDYKACRLPQFLYVKLVRLVQNY